jgi:hypothetical protein
MQRFDYPEAVDVALHGRGFAVRGPHDRFQAKGFNGRAATAQQQVCSVTAVDGRWQCPTEGPGAECGLATATVVAARRDTAQARDGLSNTGPKTSGRRPRVPPADSFEDQHLSSVFDQAASPFDRPSSSGDDAASLQHREQACTLHGSVWQRRLRSAGARLWREARRVR